jgi:hypothetical protein
MKLCKNFPSWRAKQWNTIQEANDFNHAHRLILGIQCCTTVILVLAGLPVQSTGECFFFEEELGTWGLVNSNGYLLRYKTQVQLWIVLSVHCFLSGLLFISGDTVHHELSGGTVSGTCYCSYRARTVHGIRYCGVLQSGDVAHWGKSFCCTPIRVMDRFNFSMFLLCLSH